MGMVSLPPDVIKNGGAGRWTVDEVNSERLILQAQKK